MVYFEVIFLIEKGLPDGRIINNIGKILIHKDLVVKKESHKIQYMHNGFLHTITNCIIK